MGEYWDSRQQSLYYRAVHQFVAVAGRDAQSIVDIGSANTDYITWFDWIENKTQVSIGRFDKDLPGVTQTRANFLDWIPDRKYDLALCLQVLEHVPPVKQFCLALKEVANHLIISVPYKWSGAHPGHIHDPVDEKKLRKWMGVAPNHSLMVGEPFGSKRLIAYYDLENGPKHRITRETSKKAIADHPLMK